MEGAELTFEIKDSGERTQFSSGMQRDVTTGKIDYTLALDGPMFERYAIHLTKGAEKYEKRNWLKASGLEELNRFEESALRHLLQWLRGDRDEDHASAVWFNVNGAEYVREQMEQQVGFDVSGTFKGGCGCDCPYPHSHIEDRPVDSEELFKNLPLVLGDVVRVVRVPPELTELQHFAGRIGTIAATDGLPNGLPEYVVKFDDDDERWFHADELERVHG